MLDYNNPQHILESKSIKAGEVKWRSPSNIALIKYWGKHGNQLPNNASISFTLNNAYTETQLQYKARDLGQPKNQISLIFEGEKRIDFEEKIRKNFEKLDPIFPFLKQLDITIHSSNSFPHSAGIASSASSMSALALCLCSMESYFFGTLTDITDFRRKASYVSRLMSGSASRSIYSEMALWGKTNADPNGSDDYAIPYKENIHEVFKTFHDDILIVKKGEKSVSSRVGHQLMENNIYAANRYKEAEKRMQVLVKALKRGDVLGFGKIVESEALTLHALMMTSNPPYILMEANSLNIIQKIQNFRKESKLPLYFTLDAGPNPHLLYPNEHHVAIKEFIKTTLLPLCEDEMWIEDTVGEGPIQL